MKVYWTKEALEKLQQIKDFISQDNTEAALKFVEKLISMGESIVENPERGRIVPELSISEIREIVYKNYRIVYLLKKNSIDILTVFESRRLLKKEEILQKKKSN